MIHTLKEFLRPDKRKLAIFALLIILLIPVSMIGSAAMVKADTPSSEEPLLESLEETLGPLGQFIITVCSMIYLLIMLPIFFFALITQSSSYGFVLGSITTAFLFYIVACLLNAVFLWIARKTSKHQGNPG